MKRLISLSLLSAMTVSTVALAACGENTVTPSQTDTTIADTTAEITEPVETSSLPDSYDLNGYEFRVIRQNPDKIAWSMPLFAPEEQNGEILNDEFYNRNQRAMEKYNFTISITSLDSDPKSTVRSSVLAGDDEYDMALIAINGEKSAYDGTYYNLYDLPYLDLERSWWNQSLVRDMTINGKLCFMTGDIIICENDAMMMYAYNRSLGDDFKIGNLYDVVREGNWTIDKMYSYMKLVAADLNGDEKYDENDRYGLAYADNAAAAPFFGSTETYLFAGSGNNIVYNSENERAYTVYEKMQSILSDTTMSFDWSKLTNSTASSLAAMQEKKQILFQNMVLSWVRRNLREVNAEIGLLPMPKLDEHQENYATMINLSCPYVFVPSSVQHPEQVGFILEALAAESKPITETYYHVAMQSKYTRDEESYEMIELAQQNIVYDLGFVFDFGGMSNAIRLGIMTDTPYASLIASYETAAKTALEEMYTKIAD